MTVTRRQEAPPVVPVMESVDRQYYDEPRYRPSPWLKRRVMLGLPLSAPESRVG